MSRPRYTALGKSKDGGRIEWCIWDRYDDRELFHGHNMSENEARVAAEGMNAADKARGNDDA